MPAAIYCLSLSVREKHNYGIGLFSIVPPGAKRLIRISVSVKVGYSEYSIAPGEGPVITVVNANIGVRYTSRCDGTSFWINIGAEYRPASVALSGNVSVADEWHIASPLRSPTQQLTAEKYLAVEINVLLASHVIAARRSFLM